MYDATFYWFIAAVFLGYIAHSVNYRIFAIFKMMSVGFGLLLVVGMIKGILEMVLTF